MVMEKAQAFIKTQKLMVIASYCDTDVWVANVYIVVDGGGKIYFVSSENTKHSKMILKNPNVSFSISWFDPGNHKNRKAIQGLGVCKPAENDDGIKIGVDLHNQNFPEFKKRITVDWVIKNDTGSKVWVLKPRYMKYWDDELYGIDGTKEFIF
jgi:uncharacterized protein YhbP (UPF0306 family)